jgi:AcrR family transcriptional regulator
MLDKVDQLIENCKMSAPSPASSTATSVGRRRQQRAEPTRAALLEAALVEFAAHGYDGASTRRIAARARTPQPQINYHFESKRALWCAAVDHLFTRLDASLERHIGTDRRPADDRERFAQTIRAFVHAAAELPELNRIMVQEATVDSDRLRWIVERHTRPRFEVLTAEWRRLRAAGLVADLDEVVVYYSMVGAASLAYVNAPEARLFGHDTLDPAFVEAHADAVVAGLLGRPR